MSTVRKKAGTTILHIFLVILAIQSLYPIVWVVMSSLNPGSSLFSSKLIPDNMTISHYVELFTRKDFGLWFLNTLKVALYTMVLTMALVTCTGYALSHFRFRGRRAGLMSMLILQMFPSIMNMVSIYVLLYLTGLIDTHLGLILIYVGGLIPGTTWYVKGFFDSIPKALSEAAKIDGAGNFRIFLRIILPLSVPVQTFVMLLSFITPWMDFAIARLVISSAAKRTVALGLYDMIIKNSRSEFTMFAAGAVLIALPITILYVCLQKYLIHGLGEGAAKY
jgi:arabinogalactan oligomer/maltooligosaccharide transport system permease protein